MNRTWFARTQGYQSRRIAYNLEEVDVSLQLHALGAAVVQIADLSVVHDHSIPPLDSASVEAATLVNTALFPVLRYPCGLWPQAALSLLRRLLTRIPFHPHRWTVLRLAWADAMTALPLALAKRQPAPFGLTSRWLALRRQPVRLALASSTVMTPASATNQGDARA
jgi:hypothetical protein